MSKRRAGIILQARMGSSRLPGKVMRPMAGKPMIYWIIERLKMCRIPEILILATSTEDRDQPLADYAENLGASIFRGSESDVLDRYYECARLFKLDDIVRATADNPLVDPEECDRLLEFYYQKQLDFTIISTDGERGYPVGVGVEAFNFRSLQISWNKGLKAHHREHVDEYMLENPAEFKQEKMLAPLDKCGADISFTVDTNEEFNFVERLYLEHKKNFPGSTITTEMAIKYARGR